MDITTTPPHTVPKRPSHWNGRTGWLLLFVLACIWSLAQAGLFAGRPIVNVGGWGQFTSFWQAALQPTLTSEFLLITLRATFVTLAYAVVGTFLSLLLGFFLGVLVSEVWWASVWPHHARWRRVPWGVLRALLAVPRGIHELLWGLFFLNIFGLDPLVAILAIGIPYGATVAKVFSEILDESDHAPLQALLSSGSTASKAILYGLLPLALADMISYAFYRFECAIRAAAILGVIGAGGLGYQILLSMQTLNYNETWTLFYALMLLSGLADVWSAQVRQRLGRTDVVCAEYSVAANGRILANGRFDPVLRTSILAILVLLPLSVWYLQPTWSLLWSPRTAHLLENIVQQAWPLNLTSEALTQLFNLSQATVAMSILAAALAALGGAFFSFPAARYLGRMRLGSNGRWSRRMKTAVVTLTRLFLLLLRAIPAPIWALLFLFVLFPGILPGAMALAIYNMGILGRLMAEVVENQDERPSVAIHALGANSSKTMLYGLLPAVSPRYTAYSLYRWENAIRETVVVGLVGAGGLGRELTQQLSAFNYRAVLALLICMVLLTFAVDLVSTAVRKTLR